ncbi:hypothetical protein MBLNU457_1666t1 [Dothideomycetes sp. NU457]
MAPPALTPAEHELLAKVLKTYPIDIDSKRLGDELSMRPEAARMRWTRFKDKIIKTAAGEASASGDADDGEDTNTPKTPASGRKRKAKADTPATGKKGKGKGKAAKNDDSDDQDAADAGAAMDEVDNSPSKKVKVEGDDEEWTINVGRDGP